MKQKTVKQKIVEIMANISLITIFAGIWVPDYRGRLITTGLLILFICVLEHLPNSEDGDKK